MAERRRTAAPADQDERLRRITVLSLRLLTDLARGGYGDRPEVEYLAPSCAAKLQAALAEISCDVWYVEADYGEAASGIAHLDDEDGTVGVELMVDDRSLAREPGGPPVALPPARWRVTLALDSRCTRITGLRAEAA